MNEPPPPAASQFEQLIREDYVRVYYHWVRLVCDHLSDCSRVFGGDLQKMLILSQIGQSQLTRLRMRQSSGASETPYDASVKHGTTVARLGDITGIPRETVRRKLCALAEQGWVSRDENGLWSLIARQGSTAARLDLKGLEDRAITRASQFSATMARELARKSARRKPDGAPDTAGVRSVRQDAQTAAPKPRACSLSAVGDPQNPAAADAPLR